jgi:hypothetical protein
VTSEPSRTTLTLRLLPVRVASCWASANASGVRPTTTSCSPASRSIRASRVARNAAETASTRAITVDSGARNDAMLSHQP